MRATFAVAALAASVVSARDIWIQVVNNATANATQVFQPAEVTAKVGDTVWFNFTQGNHSAIQSTFAAPCIPAHDFDITLNGFNSGVRPAGNGTAVTNLPVPITPDLANKTLWFFDNATCGGGGVGGINVNESSYETLLGFQRNAIRLNGTAAAKASLSSSGTKPTGTNTGSGSSQTGSGDSDSGASALSVSALAALPLALAALLL
jgi:plastocyanin